jgi:hypothetical protein
MRTQRFRDALRTIVAEDLQDNTDLWPEVRSRVGIKTSERRPLRLTHPGWAVVIFLSILAFGMAAYAAVTSFLDRAVELDPSGSRYLVENGLVEKLGLSQTVSDVTATLEWAYADANRIMIAYTISHPSDRETTATTLRLEDGTILPRLMGGYGYVGDGLMSQVENFDAGNMQASPDSLQLRFHLEVSTFDLPDETPSPVPATVDPETGVSNVILEPMERAAPATMLDFKFSLPFHAGRKIEIGQAVEESGISATLEQAVIAGSDTRFVMCFAGLESTYEWEPIFTLETPKLRPEDSVNILRGGNWIDDRCYHHDLGAPLEDHQGKWVLTVTELVGEKLGSQHEQIRIRGPWQFQFLIP